MSGLHDRFGRVIKDLRISVTPRCNYKCSYCDPLGKGQKDPVGTVSVADVATVVDVARFFGMNSLRFTGGEPLLRKDLPEMIAHAKKTVKIKDVAITTNASLLKRRLPELIDAGLDRVNISLDALKPDVFRKATNGGEIKQVLEAIDAVYEAGLQPLKINSVIMRGVNDTEISKLAKLTKDKPFHIRFIEYMHLNNSDSQSYKRQFMPGKEIRQEIEKKYGPLKAVTTEESAPARLFKVPGWQGAIGFINPVSEPFCNACSRMRLTSDAKLRPCLLNDNEIDIRKALDSQNPKEAIKEMFLLAAQRKVKSGITAPVERPRTMVSIGG